MVNLSDKAKAMNELCVEKSRLLAQSMQLNAETDRLYAQYMRDIKRVSAGQQTVLERLAEIDDFLHALDRTPMEIY